MVPAISTTLSFRSWSRTWSMVIRVPVLPTPALQWMMSNFLGCSNNADIYIQVNALNFKGHIGIVEKAQETSLDSDMHNTVCLCHCCTS